MFEWDNLKIKSSKYIIINNKNFLCVNEMESIVKVQSNSIPKIDRLEHMTTTSMTTSSWEHMISCAI